MTNEIAIVEAPANSNELAGYTAFSSIQGADLDTRFQLTSAVMGATSLEEVIGVPFNLAHIVRQPVIFTDKKTGERRPGYRTTLVTDDGRAFSASSKGIDISVDNILSTLGTPANWGGRSFPFVGEKVGKGSEAFYTLRPVAAK